MSLFFTFTRQNFQLTQVPNLTAWYDGSDTSTITQASNLVSQWNDKSGNALHATAAGALRPTTNTSTQNGKNIIDFSGTTYMTLPSGLYTVPNGANTMFVVSKRTSEAATINTTVGMAAAGTNAYFHIFSATAGTQSAKNRTAAAGTVSVTGLTNTAMTITAFRRTGTTQGLAVNNGTENTNTSGVDVATINEAYIGAATGGALTLTGNIAEIAIYTRYLSTAEITRILRYLSAKWAITIS